MMSRWIFRCAAMSLVACCLAAAPAAAPATAPSTAPAFEPTKLSLKVRNANLFTTITKVFHDANVPFSPPPDFLLPRKGNNLTISIDNQPFWLGVRTLCQNTGLKIHGGDGGAVSVNRADETWNNPAFSSG